MIVAMSTEAPHNMALCITVYSRYGCHARSDLCNIANVFLFKQAHDVDIAAALQRLAV